MHTVHSTEEFREYILKQTGFTLKENNSFYRSYINSDNEIFHFYHRDNCYEFGIAEYTIPSDFKIAFSNPNRLIRFGIVYKGTTRFKLNDRQVDSFSPSSFFVLEENLSGMQAWKKGQHFHGIEVTLYADYFDKIVTEFTGAPFDFSKIETNHTRHYLSTEMTRCLQQFQTLAVTGKLNAIYLESKITEFIAILYNEINLMHDISFTATTANEKITIGKRTINLSSTDLERIREAHEILTRHHTSPPTIDALSHMVLLNTQKLKAGFVHMYHQTIGNYVMTLKMVDAANLLCTTNKHVNDIALEVGYSHSGNFINMFTKYYGQTPHKYREERIKKMQDANFSDNENDQNLI